MIDPAPTGDASDSITPDADGRPYSFSRWLAEFVVLVGVAFALAWVLKGFVVQPFYVPSGSMEPTIMTCDRVLVNKFVYRFTAPKLGDIVVVPGPPSVGRRDLVKRIAAVGGQTVELREGTLYRDGARVREPYVSPSKDFSDFGPYTVPRGMVFLMGDNRPHSKDSRYIGPLPASSIVGKAFVIYWPLFLRPGQQRIL